ncbi:neuronal acetylcholine receptor subunit alpha-7-like isoform X1 [Mizuhopecten yessoensis]|uniref:neuronal acetylcholine receptor subunit alpha-7-like isoform X1 n=1 Tax=Mizuhopecten yessoensis TaxID=6573 RepID=UPI000B459E19|nr:neuronal acetylcholine receptor subunit alpha-7-like isoform X1 [Mizuhopecten yessoensis]XP_021371684.1 neuronal acetylcholine receptor subunit alpha-7-like isoform X1 [Mizuhopecten yessoensis]XP_021371685.1 neuronal acetylcholine receptor subunit alpha-7-like isoform X1 [Mizuhopecten yessoensis]
MENTRLVRLEMALLLIIVIVKETLQGSNEKRLLHYLFVEKHYNNLERPVENESQAIVVQFSIVLQQIIDVDEKMQILHSNVWLNMKWKDCNLVWNPEEFGGIASIRVPAAKVWKPDILMYNSADEAFDGTFHTNVIVYSDGSCSWIPPGMFKSTCAINIAWFPFDEQKCTMKFGSWTHPGQLLDLQLESDKGDTSTFIRNGEWKLLGVPAVRSERHYKCCPEFYIDITVTIHIQRRTLYYGFNIIIPCVLISSMSLLLFMLPPDSGEKISLGKQRVKGGVTILLSLMVFLLLVAETMPPTSDAVPLIGIYFCCIMVMCSLSVMFTVIVLNFHYRGPDTHRLPDWVRKYINGWLASGLQMKRQTRDPKDNHRDMVQRSRLRDVVLQDRQSRSLLPNVIETDDDIRYENGSYSGNSAVKREETTLINSHRSELISILKELRKITLRCKREEEDTEMRGEWRFAAMVIDRLCLWICVMFTLASTMGVLFSAPHLIT